MFWNRVFSVRNVQIWIVPSSNLVDLVILRNRFFRLRNGEIFSSLSLKRFVLLMLRNSVFKLQIFQIRILPSCKRVDLLMLRNRVFRVRKIRILSVIISIIYFSEIVFSGAKHSNRSSTILQDVIFADVQESRFQGRNVQIWAVLSNN